MQNHPLPRLDREPRLRELLLPYCRLKAGDIWRDSESGHRVGCLDASDPTEMSRLMAGEKATLAIQDPPYNLAAFETRSIHEYVKWCASWVRTTRSALDKHASLYVWMGADQTDGFQPLPDFIVMMRKTPFRPRSLITMRNQRGYGTQKNWMAVRQELLYYTLGSPVFNVSAEYTDIPKILRGYYKKVSGKVTENLERSKSDCIRAGNVWVDVQQVFYRMEENVNGCYAQKPLKATKRIMAASSSSGDVVVDFFAHSGSTLLAAEISNRRCFTADVDPVFCEITVRRLEHYRQSGSTGWQNGNPFGSEIRQDQQLRDLVRPQDMPQPALFDQI